MNLARAAVFASLSLSLPLAGCSRRVSPTAAPALAARGPVAAAPSARAAPGGEGARLEAPAVAFEGEGAATPAGPDALDAFAHVIHLDAGRPAHVVLSAEPADAWAAGLPELIALDGPTVVRRAVNARAVPREIARHVGQRVRLMAAGGEVCEAVLGPLSVVGRAVPHFGVIARWNGERDESDGEATAPLTPGEIAAQAWDETEGGRVLAAEVRRVSGDCAGALWARAASLPAAAPSPAVSAEPALRRLAVARMRALPGYAAFQRDFVANGARRGARWDETGDVDVTVMAGAGGASLVWISARAGEGCGQFYGSMVAMWEVSGDAARPRFVLRHEGTTAPGAGPASAVDADGDGRPEVVFENAVLRDEGAGYEATTLEVPNHDCGC